MSLARKSSKDVLGDIRGAMEIAAASPKRGIVNEVNVTVHEFGESLLVVVLHVRSEQGGVIVHGVHLLYQRRE
jgi:hypothetical protein